MRIIFIVFPKIRLVIFIASLILLYKVTFFFRAYFTFLKNTLFRVFLISIYSVYLSCVIDKWILFFNYTNRLRLFPWIEYHLLNGSILLQIYSTTISSRLIYFYGNGLDLTVKTDHFKWIIVMITIQKVLRNFG